MIKILICDDDEGISELLKTIFEENNYQVKLLSSGKGIIKEIKEFKPNLIFLDIWMPGMDGKEAVKVIKKDTEIKEIPIIIISALNEGKQIAKGCGADEFMSKPFDINNLIETVEKYIK